MDEQRFIVVIGAASGIGEATARVLAASGHTVVAADVTGGEGIESVDVTDEDSVSALFDAVVERHGGFQGVVNCAGVSTLAPITEHDAAEFRHVVDICLTGAFLVLKHAGRRVVDGGALVSLTSLNAS